MTEKERPPVFNLRIAKGLVDDVAGQTEDVVKLQQEAHDEDRFLESLKIHWKTGGEIAKLEGDLNTAVDLASKALSSQPDVSLEDGTTPQAVIAQAHFQGGLLKFRFAKWEEALHRFEESYKVIPTQEALFNIALCQLRMVRRFDPFAGLKNPMKGYEKRLKLLTPWKKGALKEAREGFGLTQSFVAGSYSTEEIIATFNRVIDMDPGGDVAIEAGKILVRLRK